MSQTSIEIERESDSPLEQRGDIPLKYDGNAFGGVKLDASMSSKHGIIRTREEVPMARNYQRKKFEDHIILFTGVNSDAGPERVSELMPTLEALQRFKRFRTITNKQTKKNLMNRGELRQLLKWHLVEPRYTPYLLGDNNLGIPLCRIKHFLEEFFNTYGNRTLLDRQKIIYLKSKGILTVEQLIDIDLFSNDPKINNNSFINLKDLDKIIDANEEILVELQQPELEAVEKSSDYPVRESYETDREYNQAVQLWEIKNPHAVKPDTDLVIPEEDLHIDKIIEESTLPASPMRQPNPNNPANNETPQQVKSPNPIQGQGQQTKQQTGLKVSK